VGYGCSSDEDKKVDHYQKGKQYFDKGEYKSAVLELKNAVEHLTAVIAEGGSSRAATLAMTNLAEGIQGLVQHMRAEQQMIRDWVEAQASRERELKQVLDRLGRERV